MESLQATKNHLLNLITSQRLSHAYALTGKNYPGKQEVSQYLMMALTCPAVNQEGQPDGTCTICQRIKANQFPDVLYVEASGLSVKVDQIRSLKEWLATSPVEADCKLAVIEQAELMNQAASNALLTVLEEPYDNVYLLLWTPSMSLLLPTIQSRVQELKLSEATNVLETLLAAGIDRNHAEVLTLLSSETRQRLQVNYKQDSFTAWLKALNFFYSLLIQNHPQAFVSVQTQLKPFLSKQQALDGLEYLMVINAQLLESDFQEPAQIFSYQLDKIKQATQPKVHQLLVINQEIIQARQYILANVQPQLAYENMTLSVQTGQ
ncbi:hypothetical protein ACWOBE_05685 [Hutsoniella sourekii]